MKLGLHGCNMERGEKEDISNNGYSEQKGNILKGSEVREWKGNKRESACGDKGEWRDKTTENAQ